jgi:Cdc6-like AAA superfamily ATPase
MLITILYFWLTFLPQDQRAQLAAARDKVAGLKHVGKWILGEKVYQSWESGSESSRPYLWLCGALGTGKTILTSTVIQHLAIANSGGLAYFFCSESSSQGPQNPLSILRSILRQLANTETGLHTLKTELQSRKIGINSQNGRWRLDMTPDEDDVKSLIVSLVEAVENQTFLIIDALDELGDCEILLLHLEEIGRACKGRCRFFASSRPGPERQFASLDITWSKIDIRDKTRLDIEQYIDRMIYLHISNKRGMTPVLEDKIRRRLKNGAKGV